MQLGWVFPTRIPRSEAPAAFAWLWALSFKLASKSQGETGAMIIVSFWVSEEPSSGDPMLYGEGAA